MLYEYDGDFFMLFYNIFKDKPFIEIPDVAFMFMEIDGWQGMCQRCGVWQYYESGSFDHGKFERVLEYLKSQNEYDMAKIYAIGIHDYDDPKYAENFDYPEEWIDESDKIDTWIMENEEHIYIRGREI